MKFETCFRPIGDVYTYGASAQNFYELDSATLQLRGSFLRSLSDIAL